MSVTSKHPDYTRYVDRWLLVRDVVNSNVEQYILDIDPTDKKRCDRYKQDAILTNFTSRTKNGLVGAVFRKDIEIDLPSAIKYLEQDATGSGMSLEKVAQESIGEVLQAGRYGLLVDFPASEEGLTAAEVSNMNLKARISRYDAESIINWRTEIVDGIHCLSLVVLEEYTNKVGEDGFSWQAETQYRVLRLINKVYVQQLYSRESNLLHEYIPRDFEGNSWEHIPFVFNGAEDNDDRIDAAPLYDLAQLNIGHLKNSADYEESVHVTGQPTLMMSTDMSVEQFNAANPNGVQIGSRRGHNLGPGGSANLLQASPNQLADEAMKRKEEQAVMLGARLVMQASANETAEAARIKHSGENSVLSTIVSNTNDAILRCTKWAFRFMANSTTEEDIVFQISKEFFDKTIDPQMLLAQLQLYNSAIITESDLRNSLRQSGLIEAGRTNEDIEQDLGNINPFKGLEQS